MDQQVQPPAPAPVSPEPPVATPPNGPAPGPGAPMTPTGPLPPAPAAGGKKPKKTMMIASVVIGVVLILLGVALAWMFVFSPAAQAKKASTQFMNAASAGDTAKLYEITNSQSDDEKAFIDAAAAATKGAYALKEKTLQNGVGYFLYDLSNEDGKMSRTTVEKKDGKYIVTGYVWGSDSLALIPTDSAEPVAETPTPEEPAATSQCLVQADFDAWYKADYGQTTTELGFHYEKPATAYYTNVHFQSGTTEYSAASESGTIDNVAELAKSLEGKTYTIRLTGSYGSTNAANETVADQRAEKVKTELVAAGVPEAKVVVEKSKNVADAGGSVNNQVESDAAKAVVIKVDPTCE